MPREISRADVYMANAVVVAKMTLVDWPAKRGTRAAGAKQDGKVDFWARSACR